MSQLSIRPVSQAVRTPQTQTPSVFFRRCHKPIEKILPSRHYSLHTTRPRPAEPSSFTVERSKSTRVLSHGKPYARRFSVTAPARATVIRLNPRRDEEGNEMSIDISERAAKQLRQITGTPPKRNTLTGNSPAAVDHHLRITVESGGCHGFQYKMALRPENEIDNEEDTMFESAYEVSPEEQTQAKGWAVVVMDEASLELLKGSTVDFTKALIGSEFKMVGNPRAKSSCGCGTSFDID